MTGLFAKVAEARLVPQCSGADCTGSDFAQLFVNVINFLMEISIVLVVLFFLYGGFRLLTSAGSPEAAGEARKAMTSAVIGLVIILVAWVAVNTFMTLFVNCTGTWWKFGDLKC